MRYETCVVRCWRRPWIAAQTVELDPSAKGHRLTVPLRDPFASVVCNMGLIPDLRYVRGKVKNLGVNANPVYQFGGDARMSVIKAACQCGPVGTAWRDCGHI